MENLTGTYPIIIDGGTSGSLNVIQDGLYTVFDAACPDTGGILRLSVFGGGSEGYLGVMVPLGGALRLRRKISRAAMADFPQSITHAGPKGRPDAAIVSPASAPGEPGDNIQEESDTLWRRGPNGALLSVSDGRSMMAIPADTPNLPLLQVREKRAIEGAEYMIFEVKNGKII